MSHVNLWVHLVWATKKRMPLLTQDIRQRIFIHMYENAREKGIYVDFINGYVDHVHCLVSLDAEQSIAKIVQLIKGESSFWINRNKLCSKPFEWQEEYFAVSVSQSGVNDVREYIKNQEAHHQRKTFIQEENEIMTKYNFSPCPEGQGKS